MYIYIYKYSLRSDQIPINIPMNINYALVFPCLFLLAKSADAWTAKKSHGWVLLSGLDGTFFRGIYGIKHAN